MRCSRCSLGAVYTGKDKVRPRTLVWDDGRVHGRAGALDRDLRARRHHLAFGGMFVDDGFARFAKVVILLSAAAVLVMGQDYHGPARVAAVRIPAADRAGDVVGMMVMVSRPAT